MNFLFFWVEVEVWVLFYFVGGEEGDIVRWVLR